METPSDNEREPLIQTVSVDDFLRLQGRVYSLEKQTEFIATVCQCILLAAVIYVGWPYLVAAYNTATDKIPGVKNDP
jgi:hypothetical protein